MLLYKTSTSYYRASYLTLKLLLLLYLVINLVTTKQFGILPFKQDLNMTLLEIIGNNLLRFQSVNFHLCMDKIKKNVKQYLKVYLACHNKHMSTHIYSFNISTLLMSLYFLLSLSFFF